MDTIIPMRRVREALSKIKVFYEVFLGLVLSSYKYPPIPFSHKKRKHKALSKINLFYEVFFN